MAISLLTNAIGNAITLLLTLALEGVFGYDEQVRDENKLSFNIIQFVLAFNIPFFINK